jgi:lipid-A-disaccharide synthase
MICAGEASGDQHGARMVTALRRLRPETRFFGVGGIALRQAGMEIVVDAADLAVVGVTEVLAKLPGLWRGLAECKRLLRQRKPNLLVLIDFPDFNLHLAAVARRLRVPVLYYISPQVWAWRSGRIEKIARRVDHMAVILPFEEAFYRRHRIPVTFVGHPLMDAHGAAVPAPGPDRTPVVGMLPGSRDGEVARHLPVLLEFAVRLKRRIPSVRLLCSLAPTVSRELSAAVLKRHRLADSIEMVTTGVADIFRRCTLAVVASGTVTLEAAVAGVPMVIIYRVSPLSYLLGKTFIRVPHVGLVNLIAGRRLVPELLQNEASPSRIARMVADLMADPLRLEQMRAGLDVVRRRLGDPGASERVARIARTMIDRGT